MRARLRGREAINRITGVSPVVFDPEIRSQMALPPRVVLNDCTLREGRQIEGVILSPEECVRIAECLVGVLHVPMIQMGCYAPRDVEYLTAVRRALDAVGRPVRTEAITSAHQNPPRFHREALFEAIDRIGDCGFGAVICLATSDDLLRACAGLRGQADRAVDALRKEEVEIGLEAVRRAKARHLSEVNVNLQDFLRADLAFSRAFCAELAAAGVDTIALDDFAGGLAIPLVYKERLRALKAAAPDTAFAIHAHNTVGMALAAALAAFEGGCGMIDVGINGYGEGAGHVELAEAAYHLEFLYGMDTGIRLEQLRAASRLVADIMRRPVPQTAPLVGDNAFVFMHDKHHQFPQYPFIFCPVEPSVVGNRSRPGFGEWPGPFGLKLQAASVGLTIPEDRIRPMLEAIRDEMRWRKRPITDEEFRALARRVAGPAEPCAPAGAPEAS